MITQVLILVSLSFAPEVSGYVPGRAVPAYRQVSKNEKRKATPSVPAGCKRRALLQGSGSVIECG